ncbi:MAG TPA: hypothetical protein PKB10_12455, partial [Tepidisphaeraceae bacterium]|nr:hypothetical protein [Tepidisphaeraceae bacterium]
MRWIAAAAGCALTMGLLAPSGVQAQPDEIALGASTHELVTRWLSALELRARPHVVTTAGEFHSLRRQLARLEEAGLEVSWDEPPPFETLGAR